MKSPVLVALAFLWISSPAFADYCSNGFRFNLTSEGPWPAYAHIKKDTTCRSYFRAGGRVIFKHLFRVENAQYGSVGLIEGGYFTYTPNRGYEGPDQFILRVCGTVNGKDACSNLNFHMDVHP